MASGESVWIVRERGRDVLQVFFQGSLVHPSVSPMGVQRLTAVRAASEVSYSYLYN